MECILEIPLLQLSCLWHLVRFLYYLFPSHFDDIILNHTHPGGGGAPPTGCQLQSSEGQTGAHSQGRPTVQATGEVHPEHWRRPAKEGPTGHLEGGS